MSARDDYPIAHHYTDRHEATYAAMCAEIDSLRLIVAEVIRQRDDLARQHAGAKGLNLAWLTVYYELARIAEVAAA